MRALSVVVVTLLAVATVVFAYSNEDHERHLKHVETMRALGTKSAANHYTPHREEKLKRRRDLTGAEQESLNRDVERRALGVAREAQNEADEVEVLVISMTSYCALQYSSGEFHEIALTMDAYLEHAIAEGIFVYAYLHPQTEKRCRAHFESKNFDKDMYYLITDYRPDTIWIRDYGPGLVQGKESKKWMFANAYYGGRWADNDMPLHFGKTLYDVPTEEFPWQHEWGNFIANGEGVCIVSDKILGEAEANWGVTKEEARSYAEYEYNLHLGCTTLILVERLADEPATGHVDMYLSFADANTLVMGMYTEAQDKENYAIMTRNKNLFISKYADKFSVVEMPMPSRCVYNSGVGMTPASCEPNPTLSGTALDNWRAEALVWRTYVNVIQLNNRVLVPTFAQDRTYEAKAMEIWASVANGRYKDNVVGVASDTIIYLAGALHCTTKTLPKGTLPQVKPWCPLNDKGRICSDHGVCNEGKCVCNSGYSGDKCEVGSGTPPVNDECENAIIVKPGELVHGTTVHALDSNARSPDSWRSYLHSYDLRGPDVWYEAMFKGSGATVVTITVDACFPRTNFDMVIALHYGQSCGGTQLVKVGDDSSDCSVGIGGSATTISHQLRTSQGYVLTEDFSIFIQVLGFSDAGHFSSGNFTLQVTGDSMREHPDDPNVNHVHYDGSDLLNGNAHPDTLVNENPIDQCAGCPCPENDCSICSLPTPVCPPQTCPTPAPCPENTCPTPTPCPESTCPTPAPCPENDCSICSLPTPVCPPKTCPTPAPCPENDCSKCAGEGGCPVCTDKQKPCPAASDNLGSDGNGTGSDGGTSGTTIGLIVVVAVLAVAVVALGVLLYQAKQAQVQAQHGGMAHKQSGSALLEPGIQMESNALHNASNLQFIS